MDSLLDQLDQQVQVLADRRSFDLISLLLQKWQSSGYISDHCLNRGSAIIIEKGGMAVNNPRINPRACARKINYLPLIKTKILH